MQVTTTSPVLSRRPSSSSFEEDEFQSPDLFHMSVASDAQAGEEIRSDLFPTEMPALPVVSDAQSSGETRRSLSQKEMENRVALEGFELSQIETENRGTKQTCKTVSKVSYAFLNGASYFFVTAAGCESILVYVDNPPMRGFLISLEVVACLTRTAIIYKFLENPNLWPKCRIGGTFAGLSIFSASSFLTAGIVGAHLLSIEDPWAVGVIGIAEYIFRMITMIDSSIKLPDKTREMIADWKRALEERDYKEATRIAVTVFMVLGMCAGHTDAMYAATETLLTWCGASEGEGLTAICYISALIGALGLLPIIFVWGHRGLKQLTFGGRVNAEGKNPDPTSWHTYAAILPSLAVVVGAAGVVGPEVASESGGKVFSKLGTFATVVRFSSAILYTVCLGVPGTSDFFRKAAPVVSGWSSSCASKVYEAFTTCRKRRYDFSSASGTGEIEITTL